MMHRFSVHYDAKIKPIQNCDEATAAMQHLAARSVFAASWDQQSGVCDKVLRGGSASRRSCIDADAGAKVLAGKHWTNVI
jgi:hypothetical protein